MELDLVEPAQIERLYHKARPDLARPHRPSGQSWNKGVKSKSFVIYYVVFCRTAERRRRGTERLRGADKKMKILGLARNVCVKENSKYLFVDDEL